jgi:hypothetical protein
MRIHWKANATYNAGTGVMQSNSDYTKTLLDNARDYITFMFNCTER